MILQPSKLCSNNEIETIGVLQQVCEVYFGLSPINLNVNLWLTSFDAICERFKNVTIQDIQNSYRYAEIEKKAYTTLTRDELLQPINDYWTKRNILLAEIEKLQNAKQEELQAVEADRNFKLKAKQLYLDSLNNGKWLGDEFEADAIARNFKDAVSQEIKNSLWRFAQKEYAERLAEAEKISDFFVSVPSAQRIFARLVIEKCIEKKIKLIID